MAQSAADKKAYAKEYYEKYTKKGLKKGRKKGKAKAKSSKSSLIGVSTSGLNDDGKIEAALLKEKIAKEMNTALSKAKTQEEKDKIRAEYSKKAQSEMAKLKSDPKFAASKSAKSSGSSKSGGSKSSKSSGSTAKAKTSTTKSTSTGSTISAKSIENITNAVESLSKTLPKADGETKEKMKKAIQSLLDKLISMRGY